MFSRRDFLKLSSAGVAGSCASGWFGLLANRARAAGVKHKSCILLWMAGGPSQSHTFDVKEHSDFKAIDTTASGVKISEHLPKIAEQGKHLAILRGMRTGDPNHRSARYLMHTGFRQGAGGGVAHPSLGAVVSADLGRPEFELPNFVAVGGTEGPGYLGPKYSPLIVDDFDRGLPDLKPFSPQADFDGRVSLVDELDKAFLEDYGADSTKAHQANFQKALALMKSGRTKAFELGNEPDAVREKYGKNKFGQGCLLARRLVEEGVPFVEVALGGWDTHQDTPKRIKSLSATLDPAMGALIGELKERGLLDTTLVIWMGEFGRNPKNGSQHYARAWTTVMAGGGVKGGQVIGDTGKTGEDVKDRPISPADFFATVLTAVGIDPTQSFTGRGGRPMPKVDKNAKAVSEVFA
ncbi:MAG: DUF1501 domain-containing protein [Gemmataceae bacterium]|nr:DUF1501 domain-containing protein [Gemmataceae bacterium]